MDETITQYLKRIGKKGGEKRLLNSTHEQRVMWAKKGGRPRKKKKAEK